jgi:hypothetical protein
VTVQDLFMGLPLAIGIVFFLIGLLLLFIIISVAVRVGIDNSKTRMLLKEFLELERRNRNN